MLQRWSVGACLVLVLLLGLPQADAQQRPPPPADLQASLAAIVSQIAARDAAQTAFVATDTYVSFIPEHAWIISVAVKDKPAYQGQYFVLSEIDGRLLGELLYAPGRTGVKLLKGEALTRYLERVRLDFTPIRAAFLRHFRIRAPERGRR